METLSQMFFISQMVYEKRIEPWEGIWVLNMAASKPNSFILACGMVGLEVRS